MNQLKSLVGVVIVGCGAIGLNAGLSGCATTEYYGDQYPITTHVDVFWAETDVRQSYSVIGRAVTTEGFGDSDEMIESMREEAMKRGAHGVIVTKLDSIVTGESESGKANDDYRHTSIDREERIESKFIRYTP